MKAKRKLLISMLAIVFVLLAVVATVAIAFALTQQTITTTLNIGYVVEDIDGTASATYTIGGVTESLTAMKGNQVIGDTLVFHAGDTEDAGNLMFPEGQIPFSATNDNIVIQYTYSNTGAKHYIASMSFDGNISADNMKVEYSINGTDYSTNRYAVVVPANTANKSYWIKISIENKAKSASFTGDFKWLLSGCDPQEDSYLSLTSLEFTGSVGSYSASVASEGEYAGELVFPSSVNGDSVTTITGNPNLTQEQKNQVTSVYIPDTVTALNYYQDANYNDYGAFENYQNLQTVTFEQNETTGASVKAGTGLTEIGFYAFKGCTSLTGIEIPNTVTNIGYESFKGCIKITSLQIPASVTSINYTAFEGIPLNSLEVASGNTTYHSAGNCLIETRNEILIKGCNTSVIPTDGSVTIIGESAFDGCSGLKSVTIPDCVEYIYMYAFRNCTGLTTITIPAEVGWLGLEVARGGVFEGCTNLTSAVFENPNGWTCTLYGWDAETQTMVDETVSIDATELSNPQTAAMLLRRVPDNDNISYIWRRS